MTKVLILGANGEIARVATALFLEHPGMAASWTRTASQPPSWRLRTSTIQSSGPPG